MDSLSINVFDMVALAVLLLSAMLAFFRGFVHEVLSITAWVGAALSALYGLPYVRPKAHELIPIAAAADAVGALAIFLVVLLILSIITRSVSKQVQVSALNSLDRSLGFLFGLGRGAVVLSIAYVVLSWVIPDPAARPDWMRNAKSASMLQSGANMLRSLVPEELLSAEERARMATSEAQTKAREAVELKDAYDRLTQPRMEPVRPDSGTPKAPVVAAPAPSQAPVQAAPLSSSVAIGSTPAANTVPSPTAVTPTTTQAPAVMIAPAKATAAPATSQAVTQPAAAPSSSSQQQKTAPATQKPAASGKTDDQKTLDRLFQSQQ